MRRGATNQYEHNVVNGAIHRVIEQQAAMRPDVIALASRTRNLTFRELNHCANAVARRLAESGLTRGAVAVVRMPRSVDLAIVLLAVLKAGAAYAWIEPGSSEDRDLPSDFCVLKGASGADQCYLAIDIHHALATCASRPSPNLPILTRGSDIACVLPDKSGKPHVIVPHATVTALPGSVAAGGGEWAVVPGAFDLWIGLMSGATMTLDVAAETTAAA
jgi:hypothetical protein